MTTTASLPPLPALVEGRVSHARAGAVSHRFRHRVHQWLVDLDDLPDHGALASFHAADHLGDPTRSIRDNVAGFVAAQGIRLDGGRIVMLANARVLGHVFDPLTVHWCFATDGTLRCVVMEVHNTYGERHAYLLEPHPDGHADVDKAFYVSPFFDVSGRYAVRLGLTPERIRVSLSLHADQAGAVFHGSFVGSPRPATRRAVLAASVRSPLMPQRVSALIRAHGIWLWLRRLPVQQRPTHRPPQGV
ncbi:DUF1365 domain-containing protein [Actinomycetota bacterium]|nr:DUF1365 domain-containing protein [Micrococcales bacterium]